MRGLNCAGRILKMAVEKWLLGREEDIADVVLRSMYCNYRV